MNNSLRRDLLSAHREFVSSHGHVVGQLQDEQRFIESKVADERRKMRDDVVLKLEVGVV